MLDAREMQRTRDRKWKQGDHAMNCLYCGEPIDANGHAPGRKCPHVRALVYRKDSHTIKRVEFFSPRERMRVEYGDKAAEGWNNEGQGKDEAGSATSGGDAAGRPDGGPDRRLPADDTGVHPNYPGGGA